MSMEQYMNKKSAYLDQRTPEQRAYDAGAKSRDTEVAALKDHISLLQETGLRNRETFARNIAALKARIAELESAIREEAP